MRLSRRHLLWALLLALGLALALWATGAFGPISAALRAASQAAQQALAGGVRAVKQGQPGAWAGLMGLCFAYGFLHAAGPGHGKMLIGAYGASRPVGIRRLMVLALASSLAQAGVAVALVWGLVLALGWSRGAVEGLAAGRLMSLSHLLIAGLGLWLVIRGGRSLWRMAGQGDHPHAHPHHHDHHDHGEGCACGHSHGPSLSEAEAVRSLPEALTLIAAVALRPCSGALFLLIVTAAMGIGLAGVAGTFVMGLGTASVTLAVAALAFGLREGSLSSLPTTGLAHALPGLEIAMGLLLILSASALGLGGL